MGVIIPCICSGFSFTHFKSFLLLFCFYFNSPRQHVKMLHSFKVRNINLKKYICFNIKLFINLMMDSFLIFTWLTFLIPYWEERVRISKFIVFSPQIYSSFHLSSKQNIHFEVLLQSLAVCWLPSQPSPLSPPFPQSERTNKCQRCHKPLGDLQECVD